MNSVKLILQKILDIVKEVEVYEYYKETLITKLNDINKNYQRGEIDFEVYEKQLRNVLGKKSKRELVRYYNSYIFYLLKKIQFYNSQIFYIAYNENLYKNLKLPENVEKQLSEVKIHKQKSFTNKKDIDNKKVLHSDNLKNINLEKHKSDFLTKLKNVLLFRDDSKKSKLNKKFSTKAQEYQKKFEEERKSLQTSIFGEEFEKQLEGELDKSTLHDEKKLFNNSSKLKDSEADVAKRSFDSVYDLMKDDFEKLVPKPLNLENDFQIPSPVKHTYVNYFVSLVKKLKNKTFNSDKNQLSKDLEKLGLPGSKDYDSIISNVDVKEGRKKGKIKASDEQEDVFSNETKIGESILSIASKKKTVKTNLDMDDSAVLKEAHHMRLLLDSQKKENQKDKTFWERYNIVDKFLNVYIKRFSLYFIDSFPSLFKNLYDYLRFADIKMLSNTYINILIFATFVVSVVVLPISFMFNIFSGVFLGKALLNTIFASLISGVITFVVIYQYPSFKIKSRRRNINSNLPFAINHMAAVAASGVPPTTMFKLIAMSDEYGEVSKELRKVSDYVAIFGYDILTAVKQVASTTPARQLKEFLDSFVSTVEAGGDLVDLLKQKSDETMLSYNLERQKYNETVGTYSDIYTGIMVAAPLFFMSTLSIVNLLGGKVGDVDVNRILALGIYLFLPLLNVGFLIFVHFNQPEV